MNPVTAKTFLTAACAAATLGLAALPAQAGKTVDAIKARGQLVCGVNTGTKRNPEPIEIADAEEIVVHPLAVHEHDPVGGQEGTAAQG